jgi:D-glycero-alpha-D-manno-heptose-7-phosphate kinase
LGLAGGGTDVSPYCDLYGGVVLNATVNLFAHCTLIPRADGKVKFRAADRGEAFEGDAAPALAVDNTLALHKGVYNRVVREFNGGKPLSLEAHTYSDAPAGSGLGTSSTMVVAILKAYTEWLQLPLGEYDTARLAYEIERKDLQLAGGRQDQYAATFGGFNFIEFEKGDRVIVNPLRVKKWILNELESSLALYFTGVSRDSARIIEQQIKDTTSRAADADERLKQMHLVKKSAYTMKEAVLKGDFKGFADTLREGWEAKKRSSSGISNPHIEECYDLIMRNGGLAAKVSGAGGGGFMMIYCDPVEKFHLVETLKKTGGRVHNFHFTKDGTEGWTV